VGFGSRGPKGNHYPNRTAHCHGYQATSISMENQLLAIERPRVRSIDTNQELPVPSCEAFANDDQLLEVALNRMLYGMSLPETMVMELKITVILRNPSLSPKVLSAGGLSKPARRKPRRCSADDSKLKTSTSC
jgi:hypothetical protein